MREQAIFVFEVIMDEGFGNTSIQTYAGRGGGIKAFLCEQLYGRGYEGPSLFQEPLSPVDLCYRIYYG